MLNDEHTDRKFILYFMLGWGKNTVDTVCTYRKAETQVG